MATLSGPNTKDASGASVSKLIRAYHRETGIFLGEVASSPVDGSWSMSFPNYSAGEKCFAICHDGIGFANKANVVLALDFEGGSISPLARSIWLPAGSTTPIRITRIRYPWARRRMHLKLAASTASIRSIPMLSRRERSRFIRRFIRINLIFTRIGLADSKERFFTPGHLRNFQTPPSRRVFQALKQAPNLARQEFLQSKLRLQ